MTRSKQHKARHSIMTSHAAQSRVAVVAVWTFGRLPFPGQNLSIPCMHTFPSPFPHHFISSSSSPSRILKWKDLGRHVIHPSRTEFIIWYFCRQSQWSEEFQLLVKYIICELSLFRLWRFTNHLLTYLLTYLLIRSLWSRRADLIDNTAKQHTSRSNGSLDCQWKGVSAINGLSRHKANFSTELVVGIRREKRDMCWLKVARQHGCRRSVSFF